MPQRWPRLLSCNSLKCQNRKPHSPPKEKLIFIFSFYRMDFKELFAFTQKSSFHYVQLSQSCKYLRLVLRRSAEGYTYSLVFKQEAWNRD